MSMYNYKKNIEHRHHIYQYDFQQKKSLLQKKDYTQIETNTHRQKIIGNYQSPSSHFLQLVFPSAQQKNA